MASEEKIIIRSVERPQSNKPNDIIKLLGSAFDFADDEKSVEAVLFREITVSSLEGAGVTSKNLNKKLSVPRSTIIYHLNRFMTTGFVVRKGRKYYLRSSTMASTIEEIQFDMEREFDRLIKYAEILDRNFEKEFWSGVDGSRKGREGRKVAKQSERRYRK